MNYVESRAYNSTRTNYVKAKADLGMFSMFSRTGAPTKRGPHKRTWAENNHVITKYSVHVG